MVSTAQAQVLINEFDADQTGTDAAEFVELYDGGTGNTSLDGHVIVFFNGSDDASYEVFDLDGFSTDADGYFVLCGDATMVPNCDLDVEIATNLIQNGADAIALLMGDAADFPEDTPVTTDNLVDAVVYGTSDGDDSGLLVLLNEGQPQIDENANEAAATESNQRIPNGAGGARNTDAFVQLPPTPGAENVQGAVTIADIRINEISHGEVDFMGSTNWVELYNAGDSEVDIADLILCDFPSYPAINSLTVLSGSTTLAAGGYVVLGWTNLDADAEVGLYQADAQGDFANADKMIDYMQYASAEHEREGTAVEAGVWTAGEFVELANTGETLQYFDNGMVGSGNWASAPATPGEVNVNPVALITDIRINEVSHGEVDFMGSTNWVELYNAGDSEVDISNLILCDFPNYPVINTLTVLSGSTTLAAGDYVVLGWTNLDDDAEVGLYQANASGDFGNADLLIDYMQYASAGHEREETAVAAGVWTAGEFVALAGTGESLQYFDNGMVGSGNWTSAPATPGAENAEPLAEPANVVINEFDVDQTDTDAAEFVELYDGGTGNTSLDGHVIVFFNGSDDASYEAFDLDGFSTDADGYFVLCGDPTMVANCDLDTGITTNLLQNGADAIGVYVGNATSFPEDTPVTTENLIDAVVYGTSDDTDTELLVLLNEGQGQIDENANGAGFAESNQRIPNGEGGARNTDAFVQLPPTPGAENVPGPVRVTDIRINEVSHGEVDFMGSTNWVELYNAGDSEVDISDLILCDFPNYPVINSLTVLSGSTTLAAGGYVVLGWTNLDDDAEVGLYQADASGDFGNADLIIDYMQYASAGHEREETAVAAGVWTAGEFVALASTSQSLQYFDNGMVGSGNWASAPATPGEVNADPVAEFADIRINEISHGEVDFMGATNWIELFNAGETEVDISDLILCDFPNYPVINSLTVLSGSTTLSAGGYVVLAWTDLDDDAEVGLYQADAQGDFGNVNKIIDYMQYASAGHQREGTAVAAGLWTAGEFVALAGTGESLQYFNNSMIGSGNWVSVPATPGAENVEPLVEPANVVINEFDSDQTDTDAAEFIELYDGGTGNTALDGHVLVLFNGGDDASYQAFDLDGWSTNAEGYFVLCGDATMVDNCDLDVGIPTNLIQNGADAIALIVGQGRDFPFDTPVTTENLVDAVVYGTSDDDDAELLVLLNEGQGQIDENANEASATESNQRIPNGGGGARNTDAFVQLPPTPGAENVQGDLTIADIRINEVSHGEVDFMGSTNWVELYNAGDREVDIADLILCDFPNYPVINSLTVLAGSTTLGAGEYVVLAWSDLDADAEVGLYQADALGDFGNADKMIDYMQYASAGHQREATAVAAGVWTEGEFVPLAMTGETLQYFDNGMVGAGNWASAQATPGEANEEPAVVVTDIRINEVSHGEVDFMGSTNWVELYNAGASEVDISNLILCDFPNYPVINSLTVLAGSTTLGAGEYVVLAWSDLDADAEVGLYQADALGDFGNADKMIDYMQYASAGHQREATAVAAGVWTSGEFVPLALTGETLQYFANGMVGSGNWVSSPATPGEANVRVVISNEDFEALPTEFSLKGNYPNPFNPTTTISYDLSDAGHVTLKIYSVLGREVATLVDGELAVGSYEASWNGRNSQGEVVPSGTYLYRLTYGNGKSQSRIMTLLK